MLSPSQQVGKFSNVRRDPPRLYDWRPVVELHWVVVRLNEDGSESFYSRYETEEEAKQVAATRDKAAREGRE
jgi:hypothetical protein